MPWYKKQKHAINHSVNIMQEIKSNRPFFVSADNQVGAESFPSTVKSIQ